jgi:hypothetical protein
MPKTNSEKCQTYYQKLRSDPQKWSEFLERRAAYKKSKNPQCEPKVRKTAKQCEPSVNPSEVFPGETSIQECEPDFSSVLKALVSGPDGVNPRCEPSADDGVNLGVNPDRCEPPKPVPAVSHLGGKHAASKTGVYLGRSEETRIKEQDALIEQYRQHHAAQLPPEPLPLNQHPFMKLAESHFGALTLIKVAGPKSVVLGCFLSLLRMG